MRPPSSRLSSASRSCCCISACASWFRCRSNSWRCFQKLSSSILWGEKEASNFQGGQEGVPPTPALHVHLPGATQLPRQSIHEGTNRAVPISQQLFHMPQSLLQLPQATGTEWECRSPLPQCLHLCPKALQPFPQAAHSQVPASKARVAGRAVGEGLLVAPLAAVTAQPLESQPAPALPVVLLTLWALSTQRVTITGCRDSWWCVPVFPWSLRPPDCHHVPASHHIPLCLQNPIYPKHLLSPQFHQVLWSPRSCMFLETHHVLNVPPCPQHPTTFPKFAMPTMSHHIPKISCVPCVPSHYVLSVLCSESPTMSPGPPFP